MRIRDERLPWLPDEPEPAPVAAGPAPASKAPAPGRAMWPWYLLLLLLTAAVAGGAWWLGTRQREAPPPQLPVEEPVALPITRIEPAPAPAAETPGVAAEPPATPVPAGETTREQIRRTATAGERPPESRPRETPSAARREPVRTSGRTVFPADEPIAVPPPVTGPRPVVVHHPQPNRGRVVQLGAFPTRAQADEAWRRISRRYPYLATKPKMVNTVAVRGVGGGRATRMYRLQLGTSSQAQSAVICQQLERAGQSCVVVY